MNGRLIAFEGADASGKSTQSQRTAKRLGLERTFQFGATPIGNSIRRILLDLDHQELDDRAEALLVMADKAQHVAEIVRPALGRGETIISDRFTASALAYQGYGRGLDLGLLAQVMEFATHGVRPAVTVLLDVDPAVVRHRIGDLGDRIERAGADFLERVRKGYLMMAAAEPDQWLVIDAGGAVDEVAGRVDAALDAWLAAHP